MRICVLGNSHAAALKSGWEAVRNESWAASTEVTFFASRRAGLSALRVVKGRLTPPEGPVRNDIAHTSGGQTSIDPARYSHFVIHALGFAYPYALHQSTFLSERFAQRAATDMLCASLAFRLLTRLRSITRRPILLSMQPFASEANVALRASFSGAGSRLPDPHAMAEAVVARAGGSTRALLQPTETVVDSIFTARRFSAGSTRLAVSDATADQLHPSSDHAHMNVGFGISLWRHLIPPSRSGGRAEAGSVA